MKTVAVESFILVGITFAYKWHFTG